MSIKIRNPFLLRASERIESDAGFLRLFSPIVLDYFIESLQSGKLWDSIFFIRSSPGAGKTSLLRLFEPGSLLTLQNRKSSDEFKELYKKMEKIGAVSRDNIDILGINITFTRNYELLENFSAIEAGNRSRLFYSLLNSRIITATLRSVLELRRLRFPEDLPRIRFDYPNDQLYFKKIQVPCDGQVLYEWAAGIERSIYELLDSFLPLSQTSIEGHNELFSIDVLKPEYLMVDGHPIPKRMLFMLDDLHKLSEGQREVLIAHLLEKRSNVSIWLSERLEALNNLRTPVGRDYLELHLENYWKDHEGKFEKLLNNIAAKRSAESKEDVDFVLDPSLAEYDLSASLERAKTEILERIWTITDQTVKFDLWKDHLMNSDGTLLEQCQLAKTIEILINRNLNKGELDLNYALSVDELREKTDEKTVIAARLFLCKQYSLPYYFGMPMLARIATNNVEQFLSLSAPLYERMLSLNLNQSNAALAAKDQDRELRKMANEKWKELTKLLPDNHLVIRFLENLCAFCNSETYRPTAPYAPGVTGFHIDATRTIRLLNEDDWISNEIFENLQVVINTCLAYNLLHIKETMQGKKGEKKSVYYLNRWICVRFDLPLSYGGWRSRKPDELLRWTRK